MAADRVARANVMSHLEDPDSIELTFYAGDRLSCVPSERSFSLVYEKPFAVYEVAVANVAPDLERRSTPNAVDEVLSWASYPLATAEVAELRGIGLDQARDELQAAGATLAEAAGDGYWSSE